MPKHPLEKLLQEHCPQGVEFVALGEVVAFIRGITYNKQQELQPTEQGIKVLRANNITLNNRLNFDEVKHVSYTCKVRQEHYLKQNDILICAGSGSKEHIGKVAFIGENLDYVFRGFMGVLRNQCPQLMDKFLFYVLVGSVFRKHLHTMLDTSTINNLSSKIINSFTIPLPPLIVQEKIVSILNTFTELSAELSARKKQYSYYLNALLDFGAPTSPKLGRYALLKESFRVEWVALGEVATIQRGASPRPISDPKWFDQNSAIHWVRIADLEGKYLTQTTQRLSQEGIKKSRFVPKGHLIMSMCATLGETAITKVDCCIHDGFVCFYDLSPKVDINFLFYWLNKIKSQWHKLAQSGSQANLNTDLIRGVQIPLPPLALQEKIVEILDQFNALTTDLQQGLPAEIEAREKQYTHYLNALLDFGVATGGGGGKP
ncbi:restriction endonuclease subunit S [Helicobacter felis]|uniref:restriction endonuclease subunit S n=1 Tax=Helicobacter felis TaxID=214 RepID=UPI0013153CAD|nr:restriction endonuclease subunit S [Helicobacter felis]